MHSTYMNGFPCGTQYSAEHGGLIHFPVSGSQADRKDKT